MRRQHQRHDRETDERGHQHERRVAARVRYQQEELRRAETAVEHDHVEREQTGARLLRRAVVEPALGDDIDAGEADAGDEAHRAPDHRRDEHGLDQGRRCCDCRERREHPNMTHAADQARRERCADEEAHVVAGHHDADRRGGEALGLRAHAEQGRLQAGAEHQDAHAEQQRPGAGEQACRHGGGPCGGGEGRGL